MRLVSLVDGEPGGTGRGASINQAGSEAETERSAARTADADLEEIATEWCERGAARITAERLCARFAGKVDKLPEELHLNHAGEGPELHDLLLRQLGAGKRVVFAPAPLDLSAFRWRLHQSASGAPLLSIQGGGFSRIAACVKRGVDAAVAARLLVMTGPLMMLTAMGLWALYGGPVLFRQERVGRGGRPFRLLKFRTMQRDAEALLARDRALYLKYVANNFKLPLNEDIRVTRVGRFLRASSLDELPQLLNVLKGDMSLVGPRPVVAAEVAKFGVFAPLILSVRPGLTGLWQVKGRSLIGEYDARVRLNIEYLRDASLRRDFLIMAQTVPVVLRLKDAGWRRKSRRSASAAPPAISRDEILFD